MKLKKAVKGCLVLNKAEEICGVEHIEEVGNPNKDCIIKPVYPEADSEGWIPTAKRKPKKKDANAFQEVLVCDFQREISLCNYLDVVMSPEVYTHWQIIPNPTSKRRYDSF